MTKAGIKYWPMNSYIIDEMSKFKNQHDTRSFLDTLTRKQQETLMKWLSHWRKNMIYERIIKTTDWDFKDDVPSYKIFVSSINDKVAQLIKACDNKLSLIAKSKEISEHSEFKSQGKIERDLFLARKHDRYYKIIDGSHRAIRLACDGELNFDLLVIKPIMTTFWQRLGIHFHNLTNYAKICSKCSDNMIRTRNGWKCIDCDLDW